MASNKAVSAKNVATSAKPEVKQPKWNDELFVAGVVGALKTHSNISDDSPIDDLNAALAEVVELWEIEHNGAEHGGFTNAIEAIQDVTTYIVEHNYVYERPILFRVDGFSVQLSIPTKVPNVQATFSYSCTSLSTDLSAAMLSAYADLQQFASDNFKPKQTQGQTPQNNAQDKPEDEEIEFASLRMLLFNGKMQARLMPIEGRWQQFGIPLYPDEARRAGINLSDYVQAGDYELQGTAMLSYKPDGKPMRAHSVQVS